ncbi:MAG: hypothetical protein WC526_04165 [Patescibacteria group bacterium]
MPDELNSRPGLTKTQKMGFVLLLIFAIFAVGLGALQIRNSMYGPLALNKEVPPIDSGVVNNIDTLKYRDTDHDGLSDFDEIFIYGTSPYLADTDSDGIPDGVEIAKGSSPLCNEKTKICVNGGSEAVPLSGGSPSTTAEVISQMQEPDSSASIDALSQALTDPAQVRQMLLSAGVEKKVLDSTSDADLMVMVQEILASSTISSQITGQ